MKRSPVPPDQQSFLMDPGSQSQSLLMAQVQSQLTFQNPDFILGDGSDQYFTQEEVDSEGEGGVTGQVDFSADFSADG